MVFIYCELVPELRSSGVDQEKERWAWRMLERKGFGVVGREKLCSPPSPERLRFSPAPCYKRGALFILPFFSLCVHTSFLPLPLAKLLLQQLAETIGLSFPKIFHHAQPVGRFPTARGSWDCSSSHTWTKEIDGSPCESILFETRLQKLQNLARSSPLEAGDEAEAASAGEGGWLPCCCWVFPGWEPSDGMNAPPCALSSGRSYLGHT